MNYTNKSIIPHAQHNIPMVGDIEFTFNPKEETMEVNISYAPITKGKAARKEWINLTEYESPKQTLLAVKKIAADITGVTNYNSNSRKPNYVFFRYLVVWFAFRRMKYSLEFTRNIFGFTNTNLYHGIYVVEGNRTELLMDQITWRRMFMNQIKELK